MCSLWGGGRTCSPGVGGPSSCSRPLHMQWCFQWVHATRSRNRNAAVQFGSLVSPDDAEFEAGVQATGPNIDSHVPLWWQAYLRNALKEGVEGCAQMVSCIAFFCSSMFFSTSCQCTVPFPDPSLRDRRGPHSYLCRKTLCQVGLTVFACRHKISLELS